MLLDGVVYRLFQASGNKSLCGCGVTIQTGQLAPRLEQEPAAESSPIRVDSTRSPHQLFLLLVFFVLLLVGEGRGRGEGFIHRCFACFHVDTY